MAELIVAFIFVAIVFCWSGVRLPARDASTLRDALVREDMQTLAAGVILLAAFMPAVRSGGVVYRAGFAPFLGLIFGLEAILCLALNKVRAEHRQLIWYTWEAASVATAVRGLS